MVIDKLDMLNQSQVLRYYDELDRDSKKKLLDQIDNLDMSVLDETNAVEQRGEIKPLSALTLQEIHKKKEKI